LQTKWAFSLRYVDTELVRPRWRLNGSRRVVPSVQIGFEYNPAAGELLPIATWFVMTEQGRRPAAFFGTSSDRIGSPEGKQAYYLTLAKNFERVPVSVYASLNYSEWDEGFNVPFGANIEVLPRITVQPLFDGDRMHLMATYSAQHFNVTLIHAWLERFGIAVSAGF